MARRAGARQATPFSKGAPKAQPRRSGRKAGAAYGRAAQRSLPAEVDETYDAPVPRGCPKCAGEIVETRVIRSFLFDPTIDATNWRADQALRPAVVTRKVCGGNRTPHGAHTQAVLTSVLRTSSQRHLDPVAIFTGLLTHPTPHVAPALLTPS